MSVLLETGMSAPIDMATDAFDEGYELYQREPELMLSEVWWRVPRTYTIAEAEAFVMGYITLGYRGYVGKWPWQTTS